MRALWLADVARAEGLHVVEQPGWQTRGVDDLDLAWQVVHHTASPVGQNAPSLRTVTSGRSDLPGPLCNALVARDGTVYVVAAGRANHAGICLYPDGTTGNRRSLGWECENTGVGEPWPVVQTEAMVRLNAAVAKHLGWGAARTVGHKEIARPVGRKIDPYGIDMPTFRAAVARQLVAPPPPPPDTGELSMGDIKNITDSLSEMRKWMVVNQAKIDVLGKLGDEVLGEDPAQPVDNQRLHLTQRLIIEGPDRLKRIEDTLEKLEETVAALAQPKPG